MQHNPYYNPYIVVAKKVSCNASPNLSRDELISSLKSDSMGLTGIGTYMSIAEAMVTRVAEKLLLVPLRLSTQGP